MLTGAIWFHDCSSLTQEVASMFGKKKACQCQECQGRDRVQGATVGSDVQNVPTIDSSSHESFKDLTGDP
jgi:hypothetical protein